VIEVVPEAEEADEALVVVVSEALLRVDVWLFLDVVVVVAGAVVGEVEDVSLPSVLVDLELGELELSPPALR
jgi:hypothetical protein